MIDCEIRHYNIRNEKFWKIISHVNIQTVLNLEPGIGEIFSGTKAGGAGGAGGAGEAAAAPVALRPEVEDPQQAVSSKYLFSYEKFSFFSQINRGEPVLGQ